MTVENIFNREQQNYLLALARQTLEHFFATGKSLEIDKSEVEKQLGEKRGTFVTLTKHGLLRGCIGHIEPIQPIYLDVIDNSLSAAFADPRFRPLEQDELSEVEIEISVLTTPEELEYSSPQDMLDKLVPGRDGVIIELGQYGATYLPQVWEDLPDKQEFLSSLCQKAGLSADEWRRGELKVSTYQAEVFHE